MPSLTTAEQFYADADDSIVDAAIAVYLPEEIALALLAKHGWTVEQRRGGKAYVKPGKRPSTEGGRYGHDYLWGLDESVRLAITAEVV